MYRYVDEGAHAFEMITGFIEQEHPRDFTPKYEKPFVPILPHRNFRQSLGLEDPEAVYDRIFADLPESSRAYLDGAYKKVSLRGIDLIVVINSSDILSEVAHAQQQFGELTGKKLNDRQLYVPVGQLTCTDAVL